jgi:inhibitor of cysteine peptidase
MKRILIFSLVFILTIPLFISGCGSAKEVTPPGVPNVKTLEITLDDFSTKKKQVEFFEMAYPGTVTVRLGSNPTTGYSWAVTDISSPEVVECVSNNYEEPTTDLVGAGGTEVWVFSVNDIGLSIISMSYSQPWEGGEKDLYTLTVTVNARLLVFYSSPSTGAVAITLDEFVAQRDMLKYVVATYPGTVTVKLGSNPSTGYSWVVTEIVHPEVIEQVSEGYEGPTATNIVGAGGTDVWVFNTKDTGFAIIRMSYGQQWAGGEKDLYTVSVNVIVLLRN